MSCPGRYRSPLSRGRQRIAGLVLAVAGLFPAGLPAAALDDDPDRYPDLYSARVIAEDRGNLDLALTQAMRSMLVRLTGLRRPEESPGVKEAIASPERFVQQYLFESGAGVGLTVTFDRGAVDRLVEQLGLGRWSRVRPRVIVWLAVEDERGRKSFVDSASPAAAAIDEPARERGMPFILPLLDIEDRMTLPVSTLWGGFPEPIQRASQRYAADAVLTGRAWRGETGLWKVRWTLFGELTREFRTSGESLDAAITEGMHEVVDRFAARFARRGCGGRRGSGADRGRGRRAARGLRPAPALPRLHRHRRDGAGGAGGDLAAANRGAGKGWPARSRRADRARADARPRGRRRPAGTARKSPRSTIACDDAPGTLQTAGVRGWLSVAMNCPGPCRPRASDVGGPLR